MHYGSLHVQKWLCFSTSTEASVLAEARWLVGQKDKGRFRLDAADCPVATEAFRQSEMIHNDGLIGRKLALSLISLKDLRLDCWLSHFRDCATRSQL